MRIGLYSRSGRTAVAAARDRLREAGLANISDDGSVDSTLRAARAMIRKLAPEDPAREVMRSLDFYSLPGFRDLLLHAQERGL